MVARDQGRAGGGQRKNLRQGLLSVPMELTLDSCGWRCLHRHPTLMGPFGDTYDIKCASPPVQFDLIDSQGTLQPGEGQKGRQFGAGPQPHHIL